MPIVYVASAKSAGGNDKVYHTNPDCAALTVADKSIKKKLSHLAYFRECMICADTVAEKNEQDRSTYQMISDPDTTIEDIQ